jgi:acetylglutamate synthase
VSIFSRFLQKKTQQHTADPAPATLTVQECDATAATSSSKCWLPKKLILVINSDNDRTLFYGLFCQLTEGVGEAFSE